MTKKTLSEQVEEHFKWSQFKKGWFKPKMTSFKDKLYKPEGVVLETKIIKRKEI